MSTRDVLRITFDCLILALFAYAAWEALSFSRLARYMPLYVSVAGIILTLALIVTDVTRARALGAGPIMRQRAGIEDYSSDEPVNRDDEAARLRSTAWYVGWLVAFVGLIAVIGLPAASVVFLVLFLRLEARMEIVGIAIGVTATVTALVGVTHLMHLRWPSSLLGW